MFETRWSAIRSELLSRAFRLTRNGDDAEDAVQDAAMRMVQADPDLATYVDFRRYAYRVVENCSKDIIAKRAVDTISLNDVSEDVAYHEPGFDLAETRESLLSELGDQVAEIVYLSVGFSQEEIADMMGISQMTVSRILARVRGALAA